MTYILNLNFSIAFEALDDDRARLIAEHIEDVLAYTTLPHDAEYADAPGQSIDEVLPYEDPRVVVADLDFRARQADYPADAGDGCETCQDHVDSQHATRAAYATAGDDEAPTDEAFHAFLARRGLSHLLEGQS